MAFLLFFPSRRDALTRLVVTSALRASSRMQTWHLQRKQDAAYVGASAQTCASNLGAIWKKHSLVLGVGMLVVVMPPLGAWIFSDDLVLGGFEDTHHAMNTQVAELLKGEQLTAPQALPPDVFDTKEVIQVRPMLHDASRNWRLLNSDFSQRLLMVFKIMRERHGYELAIIEGYRSPERQNMLARLGANVTNAAAFQSYHQFGLASDCAFIRDGKLVISEKDPWAMRGYQLFGETAESVGLTWGGRWKMMDLGHVELRIPGGLKRQ
jgi:peptidoglycan L-alanyl-D-glutamate endopeptidase CwlK